MQIDKKKILKDKLKGQVVAISALDDAVKEDMWQLFSSYYTDIDNQRFLDDLSHKDYAICLRAGGRLKGFSTIALRSNCKIAGKKMSVVFSGDTIIHRDYWGETELQRVFAGFLLKQKLAHPLQPTVWFLISKGYKTYLLLSRNFVNYWPRHDGPTPHWAQATIDELALDMFHKSYNADTGVLIFEKPMGRLKETVAPVDDRLLTHDDIRFFCRQNPGYAVGNELCAIGIFDVACMRHFGFRTLRKIWRSGNTQISRASRRWLDRLVPANFSRGS